MSNDVPRMVRAARRPRPPASAERTRYPGPGYPRRRLLAPGRRSGPSRKPLGTPRSELDGSASGGSPAREGTRTHFRPRKPTASSGSWPAGSRAPAPRARRHARRRSPGAARAVRRLAPAPHRGRDDPYRMGESPPGGAFAAEPGRGSAPPCPRSHHPPPSPAPCSAVPRAGGARTARRARSPAPGGPEHAGPAPAVDRALPTLLGDPAAAWTTQLRRTSPPAPRRSPRRAGAAPHRSTSSSSAAVQAALPGGRRRWRRAERERKDCTGPGSCARMPRSVAGVWVVLMVRSTDGRGVARLLGPAQWPVTLAGVR